MSDVDEGWKRREGRRREGVNDADTYIRVKRFRDLRRGLGVGCGCDARSAKIGMVLRGAEEEEGSSKSAVRTSQATGNSF